MTESLPNKCFYCGLRVFQAHRYIGSAQDADKDFSNLHLLKAEGIIENVPARIVTPTFGNPLFNGEGTTQFCAINSSAWSNKRQPCRHWQLKIEEASLANHLAIYHGKANQEIATALAIVAIIIAVVIAIFQLST